MNLPAPTIAPGSTAVTLTILSVFIFTLSLAAQRMQMNTFGQDSTDRGVAIEKAINGDGYIMTGLTKSFGSEGENIYLVKTDLEAKLVWQKTFGGKGDDNGWAIKKTMDNKYVIAGFSNGFGNGDWDILVIKTDSLGNEIWTKNYGSDKDEYAWDLIITSDNNYLILGQTNDTKNGEPSSMWMKIDESGNVIWKNQLQNPLMNRAFSIIEGQNKELYFTGSIATEQGDLDGFIAKASSHGSLEWMQTYGGRQNDLGHTIRASNDGHFILFGYSKSYGSSNNSPWLVKIDGNGKEAWNYTYGSSKEERIVAGYVKDDNRCIMLGYMLKESGTGVNVDILLLEIDHMGNLNWLKTFGGELNEESGQNIIIDEQGEIIFTGRTFSQGKGNGDLFLAKVVK